MNSDEMSEELQNVEFEVFGLEGAVEEVDVKCDEVNKRFDKHLADYVRLKKHVGKMSSFHNLYQVQYHQLLNVADEHVNKIDDALTRLEGLETKFDELVKKLEGGSDGRED